MGQRILVIEDDQSIAEIVGILLRAEGFEVSYCADGNQALQAFQVVNPDLVLLDLMLPGRDGIEICRAIRESSGIPIVMLTARSDTSDVVTGLEAGADDYIVKPIKNEELLARIRARLRSIEAPAVNEIRSGELLIDLAGHGVKRRGLSGLGVGLFVPYLADITRSTIFWICCTPALVEPLPRAETK